jgi:hypothetical protein
MTDCNCGDLGESKAELLREGGLASVGKMAELTDGSSYVCKRVSEG